MRVLHLISSSGFYGAEAVVANLAISLQRQGETALIGSLENKRHPRNGFEDRLRALGLNVERAPCGGRFDTATVRWIRDFLRSERVDITHTHGYKGDVYGYAAARAAAVPVLATCHNWTGETLQARAYGLLDRLVLRRFQQVAAVSERVRESLVRFGVFPHRIHLIPNGVDVGQFEAGDDTLERQIEKGGRTVVGFVGRLVAGKGIDVLLQAAPGVLRACPNTLFLIVGDGSMRAELESLSQTLDISTKVRFVGLQTNMPAVYRALDILVLASRNEGSPMTVLEAMAAARPVIATRTGGLPQLVSDGQTGTLIEAGDVAALERELIAILSDAGRRQEMGRKARARAVASFSSDHMARQYLELYRAAAAGRVC